MSLPVRDKKKFEIRLSRQNVETIRVKSSRNNAAAPRGRRRTVHVRVHSSHGHGFLVVTPPAVRSRDEFPPLVPSDHPRITIVQTEEETPLGLAALLLDDSVPAASPFHIGGEEVAVDDATIDNWLGFLLVLFGIISSDEMPPAAGYVSIGARHGRVPVLILGDRALQTLPLLEQINRAKEIAEKDEEVGSHDV